ncbi:MAG: hypothetical protein MJY41_02775 [Bacteroidales bacterium]|nr:hypothetical protein [Bacteroidales bacterium]
MKKIFKYMFLGLAAGMLAASCENLNQEAVFDDANAFVAFDKAAFTISEDSSDTLRIPVTLASVKGLEETISFTVTEPEEKAAKAGVNFTVLTTSGVLSFNSDKRTDYIEVTVQPDGEYTGDLKFNIVLNEGATVSTGAANTCVITINDIDHPLTPILGSYTASAVSYFNGPKTFKMEVRKDAADDHKVWFFNIFGLSGWADDDTMYYGIVNDDMTSINLPFGQEAEYKYSGTMPVILLGFDGSGGYDNGSMDIAIVRDADGTVKGLDFGTEYGIWIYIDPAGNLEVINPGITAVKD